MRLEAVISNEPRLVNACDLFVRPVEFLELMAQDAPWALGNDVIRAERLRMLIYLAASSGNTGHVRRAWESKPTTADDARRYEPGVLDLGALQIVALAAMHAAPKGEEKKFADTVFDLAFDAAGAELLGRLDPDLPTSDALGIIVTVFPMPGASTLFDDPIERARIACLREIKASRWILDEVKYTAEWDGGFSEGIEDILQDPEEPRRRLLVRGKFDEPVLRGLETGVVRVVFATSSEALAAELIHQRASSEGRTELLVRIPKGARPGWIGFSDDRRVEASNRHRQALKEALGPRATLTSPALKRLHVPVDLIPLLAVNRDAGPILAVPPRTGANRWIGVVSPPHAAVLPQFAGAYEVKTPTRRRMVLVEPRVIGADFSGGMPKLDGYEVIRLPWTDDQLSFLTANIDSSDDPRIPSLLDALSYRAMLTPGLEDALWLALVPGGQGLGAPLARSQPAEAARAVALANWAGFERMAQTVFGQEPLPQASTAVTQRLRILGQLDDVFELWSSRVEARGLGPRAPFDTGITAFALDSRDRPLSTMAVKSLRTAARPIQIALLMPVSEEVVAVELRLGTTVIKRLVRTGGLLESARAKLSRPEGSPVAQLDWSFVQSQGARPNVSLALVRGGVVTPVLDVDATRRTNDLPLTRFAKADGAVLLFNGWLGPGAKGVEDNTVQVDGSAFENPNTAVIRRLADGRYYADVPDAYAVTWTLDHTLRGRDRLLELDRSESGVLVLTAIASGGVERGGKNELVDFTRIRPGEPR
jgi:hypothetical protein